MKSLSSHFLIRKLCVISANASFGFFSLAKKSIETLQDKYVVNKVTFS
jgi:hypothetical protein